MSRIYSTSYFHYTRDFVGLTKILQNGFLGHYCKEDFKRNNSIISLYVPMVSFCDLPLSQIENTTYGDYAIGMSSVWGNGVGLNPVCYFPNKQKNPLTNYISQLAYKFEDGGRKEGLQLLSYAKSKNKYINLKEYSWDNYKERECRRVFLNGVTKDCVMHRQQCQELKLLFLAKEVTFVVVKDEQDRDNLLQQIPQWSQIGGHPSSDSLLLCSKILTKQDIRNNF